ncbi:pimeloyl-ACP methyl ester carboxylesterase [Mesoflavibacter sabulilitoris]|uniref:Alpha/beta hydrolase n=1 Tax=Mesoflavibacter zeaxanthinifaciens subsp. sabulilitoris TaxID=1520893 RepID=A0A2T1N6R7_9FLAO|nr:alpha/beta hydrolase [Mesoflavibacter zeaxanthinifaciens]MBB3123081.1 pimeloyl-ACP methyl ester carboxylesterase [Mesoflavibacter zeaxanthinifaciens subsp. sabulilitoris]PSG87271.1 alpha/beta hydrolase [Mesoflavibacter zeaxanthinifaciens subsp. sabulilitoris]
MINKNLVLKRENNKPIVWDAFFNNNDNKKPLVIFCHGYKGFKDWGAWDLVAEAFMKANLFFVKFNFSHNGGTVEQPIDFPDLEAFAENNYSKELDDLDDIITFLTSEENEFLDQIDINNISVIGHSRGGGISILKTNEDQRIKKLITWASVSSFGKRTSTTGNLEQWKKDGVKYVLNGRTNQKMPHNFQFYLDFKANEQRFNIENAVKNITVPHLIIHAKDDASVLYQEAINLNNWNPKSELFTIDNSNHVFDAKHPWKEKDMPNNLEKVINKTIAFIKR